MGLYLANMINGLSQCSFSSTAFAKTGRDGPEEPLEGKKSYRGREGPRRAREGDAAKVLGETTDHAGCNFSSITSQTTSVLLSYAVMSW